MIWYQPFGGRALHSSSAEQQSDLARLAPFEDTTPCVCGSRNRVFNTLRAVFCRRCGRALTVKPKRLPV